MDGEKSDGLPQNDREAPPRKMEVVVLCVEGLCLSLLSFVVADAWEEEDGIPSETGHQGWRFAFASR